ncbi:hypothetical protein Aduo_002368 [Ancylostoma duodenale]
MTVAHSDTFEVSRLNLNLRKASIKKIQTKFFAIGGNVDTVLANSAPRHPCIFSDLSNDNGHRTTICPQHSDPIPRTLRLRNLNKCVSCLAATHGSCNQKCGFVMGDITPYCARTALDRRRNVIVNDFVFVIE